MIRRSVEQAMDEFETLFDKAAWGGTRVIIERPGRPAVALVAANELRAMEERLRALLGANGITWQSASAEPTGAAPTITLPEKDHEKAREAADQLGRTMQQVAEHLGMTVEELEEELLKDD